MTQQSSGQAWAAQVQKSAGEQVARIRKQRGWTAQDLANRTADLGYEIKRSTIANLESGRRSFALPDLLVLAAALEVPTVALALPIGSQDSTQLLPSREAPWWNAALWWVGRRGHPSLTSKLDDEEPPAEIDLVLEKLLEWDDAEERRARNKLILLQAQYEVSAAQERLRKNPDSSEAQERVGMAEQRLTGLLQIERADLARSEKARARISRTGVEPPQDWGADTDPEVSDGDD